ncbi:MAG: PilZ domain-containing protein [Desulfuromonadales bacterium]
MNNIKHQTIRYASGMKVEVEIPLPSAKMFRDWAIISETDEDLVSLQLSRDVLPEGVILRIGQVLTITCQSDGNTHSCRAYIVSKGYAHDLLLRFTSETISSELREFFRVDAFIPIKFQILNDQNPANVKELWETQCKLRRDEKAARERGRWEENRINLRIAERARVQEIHEDDFSCEPAEQKKDTSQKVLRENQYYESWSTVTTLAVNISGGGLRIFTDRKFSMDELILLEIYVPSSQCIVDIVARVVYSNFSHITVDDKSNICTAMQFVFIDEYARSTINTHISGIQIKRIRQFKGFADVEPIADNVSLPDKHYAYIDRIGISGNTGHQDQISKPKNQRVLQSVVIVFAIVLLCFFFYRYVVSHPKSELQEMIDNNIQKIQRQPEAK